MGEVFDYLDQRGAAYSVLAGNHDVQLEHHRPARRHALPGPRWDRGGSRSPRRSSAPIPPATTPRTSSGPAAASGCCSRWTGGCRRRASPGPTTSSSSTPSCRSSSPRTRSPARPTTTACTRTSPATRRTTPRCPSYGQQLWDGLINDNDQVFLTLNGHYWPPGRTSATNAAGNDVHVHITNYQNRYFGGAAMIRLYHFDLERGTIDVETIAPYFLQQPPAQRNLLAAQLAELTTTVDRFSVPIDFAQRFSGFDPVPVRPARPAKQMLVPGTLAYWRFDAGGASGSAFTGSQTVPDLSGHGNDLSVLVTVPGSPANALTWSSDFHPDQPGHGSLYFDGQQSPSLQGAYLTTGAERPAEHRDVRQGLHVRGVRQGPDRLELELQLLDGRAIPLGRVRPGGQERGQHRPERADRHAQPERRPRAAVVRLPAQPGRRVHQLGPGRCPRTPGGTSPSSTTARRP